MAKLKIFSASLLYLDYDLASTRTLPFPAVGSPHLIQSLQDALQVPNAAAGDGPWIGIEMENLYGDVPLVVIFQQGSKDRKKPGLSETRTSPIRVIDMDVTKHP
jgi:hypothetical protein